MLPGALESTRDMFLLKSEIWRKLQKESSDEGKSMAFVGIDTGHAEM